MQVTKGSPDRVVFDSIGDLAEFYSSKEGQHIAPKYVDNGSKHGGEAFYGSPPNPEEFLKTGWHDSKVEQLAARAAACLKSHAELVQSPQITLTEHVAGAMVNIPAYLAGDPSYMFMPEMEMVPKTHPVVTIVVSGCVSAGLSNAAIERRGIYALALVRACQTLGYSVDLWHEWKTEPTSVKTHIMRPGDVISDAQIIACLVHRSWTRHFPFTAAEHISPNKKWNRSPMPASADAYPEGTIITNTAPGTDDEMAEMVKQSLIDAGVLHFD